MAVIIDQRDVGKMKLGDVTPPKPPKPPVKLSLLERHRKIKDYLEHEGYYKYKCPSITEIAEKTGFDESTLREHIDIMKEDEAISEVNEGIICNVDSLARLTKNLRELRI